MARTIVSKEKLARAFDLEYGCLEFSLLGGVVFRKLPPEGETPNAHRVSLLESEPTCCYYFVFDA
jgi:hypothetical protein